MTDRPSDRSRRIVKKLELMGTIFATKPSAREALDALDYDADVQALGECIIDGAEDTGGGLAKDENGVPMAEVVILASEAHYERVAREIIDFSRKHPVEGLNILADFLMLMEHIPYGRTENFKMKAGVD